MSPVASEDETERPEEGKEGRGRSFAPARLPESSQTRAEREEWPRRWPCQALLSPAPASLQPAQPPGDPAAWLGIHLSPPKSLGAEPALRQTLLPVPAAAASFLTPS